MSPVALVTGSSRGIGHEVARQLAARGYRVIVTSRDSPAANHAAAKIGSSAVAHALDTSDPSSIEAIARFVESEIGSLDVLVNNAAIVLDEGLSIVDITAEIFEQTWRTNTLGPFLMTKGLAPLLRKSGHGRVVNVSSGAGQLSSMSGYAPAYSTSKAALNAITILFAHALRGDRVLVNCVDPGWVRTEMGGSSAPRRVEEGADTVVWLATLPDDGPTAGFFHDRRKIAW
ncbi:MAG TPA: SDR family oxidoreductase [Thermoanaerobaculia bacterium]|nr:SDR family oxidoreductase [Thermoanaerobaculia bacterium]